MKMKFMIFAFLMSALALLSCGGAAGSKAKGQMSAPLASYEGLASSAAADIPALLQTLDELAEIERAGSWFQGLALTESSIRENAGDYSGAVAAAFKELSWAYGMGIVQKSEIEKGLLNVLNIKGDDSVAAATNAMLDFLNQKWVEAETELEKIFVNSHEPDDFGKWMLLVCALEKNKALSLESIASESILPDEHRRISSAYRSIRARYVQFPEYWYRGARAFSGGIAAEFAENCINVSPQGPYAGECRSVLASYTGLKNEDGVSIKTKKEIEALISQSINSANPQILDSLMPLISLPDNPYTVYAIGALRALTSNTKFKDYFYTQAASSKGRLSERLSYICKS